MNNNIHPKLHDLHNCGHLHVLLLHDLLDYKQPQKDTLLELELQQLLGEEQMRKELTHQQ
jgi:hypothetical protein